MSNTRKFFSCLVFIVWNLCKVCTSWARFIPAQAVDGVLQLCPGGKFAGFSRLSPPSVGGLHAPLRSGFLENQRGFANKHALFLASARTNAVYAKQALIFSAIPRYPPLCPAPFQCCTPTHEVTLSAKPIHTNPDICLDLDVQTAVLPNNMRLALCPMPQLHKACIILNVAAGSRDENNPGAAHLLEHLIFRGTKKYPSLRLLSEAFESIGADFNAYTSRECTSFDVMVPPQFIAQALQLLAESILEPRLTGIAGEREIIVEEILSDYDEDGELINVEDLLLESMYNSPLGRAIAGSPAQVMALQKQHVREFFDRYYQASNMTLVIAGNIVSTGACLDAATKAFESLPLRVLASKDGPAPMPLPPRALRVKYYEGATQSSVCLAMFGPSTRDPKFSALEMLVRILDDGMASRLSRRLVDELALVYDIEAYISTTREHSLLQLRLSCQHRRIGRLMEEVFSILYDIAQTPPPPAELERAKNRLLWEHASLLDSAAGIAQWLSSALLQGLDSSLQHHANQLLACTSQDVSSITREALQHWPIRVAVVGDVSKVHAQRLNESLTKSMQAPFSLEYIKT